MREVLRGKAAAVSGEIKGKAENFAEEVVSKTANIAGEVVSKTAHFKEAIKASFTSFGSRAHSTNFQKKIDADVAACDGTDPFELPAPLQGPSKHRQAGTSPQSITYPSIRSDVDRGCTSDCTEIPDPLELPARLQGPSQHRQAGTSPQSITYPSIRSDVDRGCTSDCTEISDPLELPARLQGPSQHRQAGTSPQSITYPSIRSDVDRGCTSDCTEIPDPLELPARLQGPSQHRQAGTSPQSITYPSIRSDVDRGCTSDCTEIPDPLELPARLQGPSQHRQAGTSPQSITYPSIRSEVDRGCTSDFSTSKPGPEDSIPPHSTASHASTAPNPTASSSIRDSIRDSSHEPGHEEQSGGTHSTCVLSTPPPDHIGASIASDQGPSSFTHPNAQALEMSGPDHSELEGDDRGEEGFEGRDTGEGEEDGKEQGGSSITSSNAGSSQAQRTPAASDCPHNSSSSLRAFRNSQSQGDAAGKARVGRAGAGAEIRSGVDSARDDRSGGGAEGGDGRSGGEAEGGDGRSGGEAEGGNGRSGGEAEGGDGASPAAGWHPTPPVEMQSLIGVSMHLVGLETNVDADVAACDCTEITDPLELPARVQSPSKHRQAATSPRSFTHSSLWSDVDRFFPSDRSTSELSSKGSIPPHSTASHASAAPNPSASSSIRGSSREPGSEDQPASTHSTCALSTPPPDQSDSSIAPDQYLISFTHPNAQVLEMSGPDHPELEGDKSGLEGFVVPQLGYEECDAEEGEVGGEEGGEEQGGGERRRVEEAEFSMNLWLMGSSFEGSSTTSSTLGGVFAGSSQAQRTPAAPDCPPDSSSSLRTFQNSQSQGDAGCGKERVGSAGAAMSVQVRSGVEAGGVGPSGGEAEGGDGATVAEGWHPTSPVVVQSRYGVSNHLGGAESGRVEECGDMDRVWEEMYVQRECASLPSSPRDSRRALPAIKRLLTIRRGDFVERMSSRDSFSSTGSRALPLKARPLKARPLKARPLKALPLKALPLKALPLKALPLKARYSEKAVIGGCSGSPV
ncbi:unnamed protein product [Closterium sp. Yama58-4]|nr:unnamed protein product [Closterium sp. Yama58-4]